MLNYEENKILEYSKTLTMSSKYIKRVLKHGESIGEHNITLKQAREVVNMQLLRILVLENHSQYDLRTEPFKRKETKWLREVIGDIPNTAPHS